MHLFEKYSFLLSHLQKCHTTETDHRHYCVVGSTAAFSAGSLMMKCQPKCQLLWLKSVVLSLIRLMLAGFSTSFTIYYSYWLTYSMEQSPSWEANRFVASQEIPRGLLNPNVHYHIHNCSPPVSTLSQPNPIHTPTSHCLKIHPIIHTDTTLNTLRPSLVLVPSSLSHQLSWQSTNIPQFP
jgi:hypothetical protein